MKTFPKLAIKYIHNSKVNAVKIVDWEYHHEVAVIRDCYTHNGEPSEGMEAAQLFSASPELFKQLDNAVSMMEAVWNNETVPPALLRVTIDEARAALEKATL
jgi:hypothetical protein